MIYAWGDCPECGCVDVVAVSVDGSLECYCCEWEGDEDDEKGE